MHRLIVHDDGVRARFEGTATWRSVGEGLRCEEAGTLRAPGRRPMTAMRTTLWCEAEDGVAVLFADGRPFHRIDLRTARPRDVHACGPDIYRVAYHLLGWPRWRVVWRVDGPAKGYRSTTCLAPADRSSRGEHEGEKHEP